MTRKKWLEDEEKEPKEESTECASTGCSQISEALERRRRILYLVAPKGRTKTSKGTDFSSVFKGKTFQKNQLLEIKRVDTRQGTCNP